MNRIRILPLLVPVIFGVATAGADDHRPIVIVHGAWGGAHHWKKVSDTLTLEHHRVVRRASLTGLGERSHLVSPAINLDTHIRDVVNVIEFDDLDSVVLVAHSYGGAVASGVADAIPDRISQMIYVDAHLLDHGESYLTHHPKMKAKLAERVHDVGDGWLIPVDWPNPVQDVPHPFATLIQPIELTNPARLAIPSCYWLLADAGDPEKDERFRYYQRAVDRGWSVKILPWNHNPQRDRPQEVVAELLATIDETAIPR